MSSAGGLGRRIYHLALHDEWRDAVDHGEPYRRSTLGKSLDDEGFIDCSFANQVEDIADLVYRGRDDVLLVVIDPSRVQGEVRVERMEGSDKLFPHLYGPVPVEAVVRVDPVPLGDDGRLRLAALLADE